MHNIFVQGNNNTVKPENFANFSILGKSQNEYVRGGEGLKIFVGNNVYK